MAELDIEFLAAFGRHLFEKLDREAGRANDRPAHKRRIGRRAIAEMPDDRLGFQKITVGLRRDCSRLVRSQCRLIRPLLTGSRRERHYLAANASAPRRSRRPARVPVSR